MNRLQHESSPYLLQHANNPVDWYSWSEEAFERARTENKPVIVSIGYSTCHWCHVMERESFENETVAAFMNQHFINIKVDREERPDIDQIYMEVCQAITGSGGWPLNCFLLPDARPFYAGTYFPPRTFQNRPSWIELLQRVHQMYQNDHPTLEKQADKLMDVLQQSERAVIKEEAISQPSDEVLTGDTVHQIYTQLHANFDREDGGFGGAPKFPMTMSLRWLLEYHYHTGDTPAREHLDFSLEQMIRGGIYDQIGGGFARYATDKAWLVPHFEKMLYDNALLLSLLADRYQLAPNDRYRQTIEQTIEWVEREMQHPEEGFYAALDADSEGEEGKFYVWHKKEIDQILEDDAPLFNYFYGVSEGGNWEGKSILWQPHTWSEAATAFNLSEKELLEKLDQSRQKLLTVRSRRIRPGLDDKQLLSWNALMITAYAKCGQALGQSAYLERAEQKMSFLLKSLQRKDGTFAHSWKNGPSEQEAFLDDYAALIEALLTLFEVTQEKDYIRQAADLTASVRKHFLDEDTKMFYFTSVRQKDTVVRKKDLYDSAVPSGNATMCLNLWLLSRYLDKNEFREQAFTMLIQMREALVRFPTSFARWARCLTAQTFPGPEVAITGDDWPAKWQELQRAYWPNRVVMAAEKQEEEFPLLAERLAKDNETLIYVCKNYSCQLPVQSVARALTMIREVST
ncbi:MAG TPA: thioredoxin domain-containing protein [Saprospiraceae bacterium]|nr:thioredoxin domain-containing protein [Saprospiraceae bacterium]